MSRSPLKALSAIAVTALLLLASTSLFAAHQPMLTLGPQVQPADTVATSDTGTNFGLFTCQVGKLKGVNCYDPYQMRTAYGVDKLIAAGFDGHGKTIVIVDAFQSPNIVQNLNLFNSFYSLANMNMPGATTTDPNLGTFKQFAPDGLTTFDSSNTPAGHNQQGWAEEITLDVLWAHAIAPGANITLVLAKTNSDDDILSATKYAVDNRLGDVISQSFGGNENCIDAASIAAQHQIFADATRKNITLFASAGDFGSAQRSCDGQTPFVQAVSSPASDPLVTAVGGTELHAADYTTQTPGAYQDEIVWNESEQFLGGEATGGGFSNVFDTPPYQKATVKGNQRGVADVSYNAAVEHGVLTPLIIPGVSNGGFFLFGGTSAGSPQWAAFTAIVDQMAGRSLGFINSALYQIGRAPAHAGFFHDVTVGDNAFFFPTATGISSVPGFAAAAGWDAPTGLGTPNISNLVNLLPQFVSPGDATAAINTTKPHGNPNAPGHGHMDAH